MRSQDDAFQRVLRNLFQSSSMVISNLIRRLHLDKLPSWFLIKNRDPHPIHIHQLYSA